MRKILIYTICFVLICFAIPIILTNRQQEKQSDKPAKENKEPHIYKKYGTVKLLHTETGDIEELNMDEYIYRSCISRNASRF